MSEIKVTFTLRELKKLLEEAITEEMYGIIKTIQMILPIDFKDSLRHSKPDFGHFKRKSKETRSVNLFHLGIIDPKEAKGILRLDAEIITKKIIENLLK